MIDSVFNYIMEAPVLYIIMSLMIMAYCIKVFRDPVFLIRSIKAVFLSLLETIKQLRSIRGILAFIIIYITLSGFILIPLGRILKLNILIHIGTSMIIFWSLPLITPLIPIVILLSMLFARYILRDKRINIKIVFDRFIKELKGIKEEKEDEDVD